jgi:hypothetical protein
LKSIFIFRISSLTCAHLENTFVSFGPLLLCYIVAMNQLSVARSPNVKDLGLICSLELVGSKRHSQSVNLVVNWHLVTTCNEISWSRKLWAKLN